MKGRNHLNNTGKYLLINIPSSFLSEAFRQVSCSKILSVQSETLKKNVIIDVCKLKLVIKAKRDLNICQSPPLFFLKSVITFYPPTFVNTHTASPTIHIQLRSHVTLDQKV